MRLYRLAFGREMAAPMLTLVFASGVSVGLVVARILWTRDLDYVFLLWNLFLAWLPLVFALLATDAYASGSRRVWQFLGLAGAWLLFFPNASYILTDLTHLRSHFYHRFWVDLTLILLCAFTGLLLGFLSLFLMQSLVRRRWGRSASWLFVAAAAALSAFGVYLGRFLRFNSWDVVVDPLGLFRSVGKWAANPPAHSFAFTVLFATFLFVSYLMLYALTHLKAAPATQLESAEALAPAARRPASLVSTPDLD